jgi:hypothetical protein
MTDKQTSHVRTAKPALVGLEMVGSSLLGYCSVVTVANVETVEETEVAVNIV